MVGRGSAFPVFIDDKQNTFFVTNKHVLDNAKQIKEECEMFYTASMFYAKNHIAGAQNFHQLLDIVNLANKKQRSALETKLYKDTIDGIWDCYDNKLSQSADPLRLLYNKYKKLTSIEAQSSYFLHATGPLTQPAIEAKVYKASESREPDLAILVAVVPEEIRSHGVVMNAVPLDLKVIENEEIQIAGYPVQDRLSQKEEYRPTFSNGKVIKVGAHGFEFMAELSKGFSGGPVINEQGKAIGVVTQRLLTKQGTVSLNDGVAIKIEELVNFAPALLKSQQKGRSMVNAVKMR